MSLSAGLSEQLRILKDPDIGEAVLSRTLPSYAFERNSVAQDEVEFAHAGVLSDKIAFGADTYQRYPERSGLLYSSRRASFGPISEQVKTSFKPFASRQVVEFLSSALGIDVGSEIEQTAISGMVFEVVVEICSAMAADQRLNSNLDHVVIADNGRMVAGFCQEFYRSYPTLDLYEAKRIFDTVWFELSRRLAFGPVENLVVRLEYSASGRIVAHHKTRDAVLLPKARATVQRW